ncbi:MAG TPA: hypothetical protein VK110_10890 [Salinisphaeraceae bacterium]|nr:hypothetical protein [Salinisphaeraceae bacterium]
MIDSDEERLKREVDRLQERLPEPASRFLSWLRKPSSGWIRIPLGVVFIVAGIFSFLPILGLWMLPLGLLLLAQDVPFLRRPILRALGWIERGWARFKTWHRRGPPQ